MSNTETQARYHDAAYTLDERTELPDDVDEQPLSAGHDEDDRDKVRERIEEHKEQAKEALEAQAERDAEWAERDPKPKPSELLAERGSEPAPDTDDSSTSSSSTSDSSSEQDTPSNGSEVPDGTVQDVLDWVGDDKARAQSALDAERDGQNRQTLIAELEKRAA